MNTRPTSGQLTEQRRRLFLLSVVSWSHASGPSHFYPVHHICSEDRRHFAGSEIELKKYIIHGGALEELIKLYISNAEDSVVLNATVFTETSRLHFDATELRESNRFTRD